jgi:hypothetical protein
MTEENIWRRLQSIPNEPILAIFLLCMIIPGMIKLDLPVGIPNLTRQTFDYIENLPEGSTVVFFSQLIGFNYGDLSSLTASVYRHLLNSPNRLNVILCFQSAHAIPFWDIMLSEFEMPVPEWREYGIDHAKFGYVIGMEQGWATLCDDWDAILPKDIHGTPTSDLPIMQEISTAEDWDLVIMPNSWSGLTDYVIRHAYGRYDVPVMLLPAGMSAMTAAAYIGIVSPGMPIGNGGGASYEKLLGYESWGHRRGDAFSLMSILTVLLGIIAIISDYMLRRGT